MRQLIFIPTRKKQFFFHANDKCTAFLRATEPNAIVPRSKYIILTKTYEPGRGGGGAGRANLIIHTPGNLFFCLYGHTFLITTPNFSFARLAS